MNCMVFTMLWTHFRGHDSKHVVFTCFPASPSSRTEPKPFFFQNTQFLHASRSNFSELTVFTIEKHAVSKRVWRALDHKSSLAILILTSKTSGQRQRCKAQEGMTQWISWFWLLRLFSILSATLPHFSHKHYLMGFLNCSCEQRGKHR